MKIGINAAFLRKPGTGIGQVTANFLQKLAGFSVSESEASKRIEWILYVEEPIDARVLEADGFTVKTFLPRYWKRDDLLRRWLWERELSSRAIEDGCDVFLSLSQSATVFAHRRMRKPPHHVMLVHDVIPRLFPEYVGNIRQKFYWKSVERGIRAADYIVTVSEASKRDIISELGVPLGRVEAIYPDIDSEFRKDPDSDRDRDVLKQYGLVPGYIYHGGGLEIRKNAEKLLRAYALLRSNRSDTPKLVISGKIFDERNRLATPIRSLIASLGLHDSVRLLGFVPGEDLPALYRGAIFFAYPSFYEGFGLPIVEAFSCGTPVLAGKFSGSVDEIVSGAAYQVDVSDTVSIAEGLARLIDDPTLRFSLSEKGRYRSKDFSWDRFTEKLFAVLTFR